MKSSQWAKGSLLFILLAAAILGAIEPTMAKFYAHIPLAAVSTFEEVTNLAGLNFIGAQYGASWGDYNGDGRPDLFVNNHFQDNPHLYQNNGDQTFTNKTAEAGLIPPQSSRDMHGSSWGDFDNDGDLDLYVVTNGNSLNLLQINQGNQRFSEEAVARGVSDLAGRGRAASWIDYNRDGLLDLFVANEDGASDKLYKNKGDGAFEDVTTASGLGDSLDSDGNVWGDYNNDGHLDLVRTGGKLRLHRNNGDGTFTDVTTASLLNSVSNSSAADFGDYDNDGDLDLYVTRGGAPFFDHLSKAAKVMTYTFQTQDSYDGFTFSSSQAVTFDLRMGGGGDMSPTKVFIGQNSRNPTTLPFTLGAADQPYGTPVFTPGVTIGAFIWQDGPGGTWNLWISNVEDTQGQVRTSGSFSNVVTLKPYNFVTPARTNQLFRNQGDGTFKDVGKAAGVASPENSKAGVWGDYDNDGWLDLYVVNSGDVAVGNQPNQLFHNNGNGTFTNIAAAAQLEPSPPGLDDCAAWADYDRNGFLDLFVTNIHQSGFVAGPRKLFRNLGNDNHWLAINLVGIQSNRQGIGARVTLTSGGLTQNRQMNNGTHYRCQNSSILHFGLGSSAVVQTLTVNWPSGQTQVFQNIQTNQFLTITEGIGITGEDKPTPTPTPTPTSTPTSTPTPTATPTVTLVPEPSLYTNDLPIILK